MEINIKMIYLSSKYRYAIKLRICIKTYGNNMPFLYIYMIAIVTENKIVIVIG